MNTNALIAGFLGFATSMVMMFWTLRNYTYPKVEKPLFDDRKAFGLFTIGLVIGIVVFSAQSYFDLAFVLAALLFALGEEAVKLIILNLPRFRNRIDTCFYGLALGLGIGSTIAFASAYYAMAFIETIKPFTMITIIILTFQLVLLHGSTGATIGIGVARGSPGSMFAQAALVHISYSLVLIPFYSLELGYGIFFFILAFLGLLLYYLYVHYRLIPSFVSDAIMKFETKESRNPTNKGRL
ncbi:MAG: hypothetical protein QXN93_05300 [Methanomassiliicoccales archaeon]